MKILIIILLFALTALTCSAEVFLSGSNSIAGAFAFQSLPNTTTPTKREEQTTDADFVFWGTTGDRKVSSSWLATGSYNLTSVKIKLAPQEGGGNCSVSIYPPGAFEGPTGSALGTSDAVATSSFPAFPGGLVEFTFPVSVAITSGQTNVMIINHDTPDGNHRVYTKRNGSSARTIHTYDGATWTILGDYQFVFETWGN